MSSPPSLPLPTSLGARFQVEEALSETPFERTFRARDVVLQREVLLKLPAHAAYDGWTAPVKERLLREARSLAKIRHDGIAPIHHVEDTPEGPLLVLDLPQGELLADRLQHGPLPRDEVIALGIQLGEALAAVHQQGVVHRAVGPATIRLLANGKMQLGSFTFAKEFGGARGTSLVHVRGAAATAPRASHLPEYPAPEQAAGQTADPRADVFALGCTLYRCLTGRDPFPLGTEHAEMPDLRALRKDIDRPLAEVIRKCMLFAKTARHATAQEVVAALRALGAPRSGSRASLSGVHRALLGAAIALGASAIAITVALGGERQRSGDVLSAIPTVPPKAVYLPLYNNVHGLFVGIGKAYAGKSFAELRNPAREVEAVTTFLRENDEQWGRDGAIKVLPEEQATSAAVEAELQRLQTKTDENDAVLLYFAGHGETTNYEFGLVLADVGGDLNYGTGYLRRSRLEQFAGECRAKHVLVVLDCCYAGAVIPPLRGRDPKGCTEPRVAGAKYMEGWSREFLCSAGAEQHARDGAHLSPFCETLLAALKDEAAKNLDHYAAKFLGPEIGKRLGAMGLGQTMQEPELLTKGQQKGSFVFRLAKRAPAAK